MSKHRAQITWPWRIPYWLPALLPHLLDINKEDAAETEQASTVLCVFVILYGLCIFVIPCVTSAVRIASVLRWIREYRIGGLRTLITTTPYEDLTVPRDFTFCGISLWNCLQSKNKLYLLSVGWKRPYTGANSKDSSLYYFQFGFGTPLRPSQIPFCFYVSCFLEPSSFFFLTISSSFTHHIIRTTSANSVSLSKDFFTL